MNKPDIRLKSLKQYLINYFLWLLMMVKLCLTRWLVLEHLVHLHEKMDLRLFYAITMKIIFQ